MQHNTFHFKFTVVEAVAQLEAVAQQQAQCPFLLSFRPAKRFPLTVCKQLHAQKQQRLQMVSHLDIAKQISSLLLPVNTAIGSISLQL